MMGSQNAERALVATAAIGAFAAFGPGWKRAALAFAACVLVTWLMPPIV